MFPPVYRGRFAPSPTGPLHFGSLVAAVASHVDARHQCGEWLVRIEDVDQTRRRDGAAQAILRTLEIFGMVPDQPPVYQSARGALYRDALDRLVSAGLAYRCGCSRKMIAARARVGSEGPVYPGTCRATRLPPNRPAAWRVALDDGRVGFHDRIAGDIDQHIAGDIGDFVIRRIDGYTAYQLAVVVDDAAQGVTDVVRGADLLWSTPRQIWLQRRLGYPTPRYAHVPLVYGADGAKLSKCDAAHPVDQSRPVDSLLAAWRHLGQRQPAIRPDSVDAFWNWAIPQWHIDRVPKPGSSAI